MATGFQNGAAAPWPGGSATEWGIRREHHPQGLATFEAIARAMGIIESPEVQAGLEALFRLMVHRTKQAKGVG